MARLGKRRLLGLLLPRGDWCFFRRMVVLPVSFPFRLPLLVTSLLRVQRASLYWSCSLVKVSLRFLRLLITPSSVTHLSWSAFMRTNAWKWITTVNWWIKNKVKLSRRRTNPGEVKKTWHSQVLRLLLSTRIHVRLLNDWFNHLDGVSFMRKNMMGFLGDEAQHHH